jgi:hypothetical protein
MDRDVYLILVGAGISLASSIITLLLQFILGLINERIRRKQEEVMRRKHEITRELTRQDWPIIVSKSERTSGGGFGRGSPDAIHTLRFFTYEEIEIFGIEILVHRKFFRKALRTSVFIGSLVLVSNLVVFMLFLR